MFVAMLDDFLVGEPSGSLPLRVTVCLNVTGTLTGYLSAVLTMIFAFVLALSGHPIGGQGVLSLDHWYHIVILSIIMPVIATLGDFSFSAVKRYYGIKDFGNIIPVHGGALDRVDSIMFTAIIVAIYVSMFFGTTPLSSGIVNLV